MIPMTIAEFVKSPFDTALVTIRGEEYLIEDVIHRENGTYLVFADCGQMCIAHGYDLVMVDDPVSDRASFVSTLPVAQIISCSPKDDPDGDSVIYVYDFDDVVILPEHKAATHGS